MLTTIHSRSFQTRELTAVVDEETEWMQRYFAELIAARWSFELDRQEVVARCELHARCGHFFGEGRAPELAAAAAVVADKAVRWRRRQKRIARHGASPSATRRH